MKFAMNKVENNDPVMERSGMDDDGKSNISEEEIVFLWDGYSYIYVLSAPVDVSGEPNSTGQLFS